MSVSVSVSVSLSLSVNVSVSVCVCVCAIITTLLTYLGRLCNGKIATSMFYGVLTLISLPLITL